jgi:hypothetical protein
MAGAKHGVVTQENQNYYGMKNRLWSPNLLLFSPKMEFDDF